MKEITFKQVLNTTGDLEALELWQGDEHITVMLSAEGTHRSGYRWLEVKPVVDKLQERAKRDAQEAAVAAV